jgi:hypothetical protein
METAHKNKNKNKSKSYKYQHSKLIYWLESFDISIFFLKVQLASGKEHILSIKHLILDEMLRGNGH